MTGLQFVADLISRGEVQTKDGRHLPLHSGTSLDQCKFIQRQMQAVGARITLEIGLAYGLSAIAICHQLQGSPPSMHHIIDPYQNTSSWDGVGLENLRRAGLQSQFTFYEQSAESCLPSLAETGLVIDLAYIDAGKRLDDTLLYSHYVLNMLKVGGRAIYDDAGMPGVRQALRYLSQDPRFRVVDAHLPDYVSFRRRAIERIASYLPFKRRLLSPELVCSDKSLGVAAHCVVLERISSDEPDWKWHPNC
jgi:predicted O-methyltransferase YrrM